MAIALTTPDGNGNCVCCACDASGCPDGCTTYSYDCYLENTNDCDGQGDCCAGVIYGPNQDGTFTQGTETTITNPYDTEATVRFCVGTDDSLSVYGAEIYPDQFECGYGPCNCAHSNDYSITVGPGGQFSFGAINNFDPDVGFTGVVCICPVTSDP